MSTLLQSITAPCIRCLPTQRNHPYIPSKISHVGVPAPPCSPPILWVAIDWATARLSGNPKGNPFNQNYHPPRGTCSHQPRKTWRRTLAHVPTHPYKQLTMTWCHRQRWVQQWVNLLKRVDYSLCHTLLTLEGPYQYPEYWLLKDITLAGPPDTF